MGLSWRGAAVLLTLGTTPACASRAPLPPRHLQTPATIIPTLPSKTTPLEPLEEQASTDDEPVFSAEDVTPCAPNSPEHTSAKSALEALAHKIATVTDGADTRGLSAELNDLLATPCFALAKEDLPEETLAIATGAALHQWWSSSSGAEWLEGYLSNDRRRSIPGSPRHALFAKMPPASSDPVAQAALLPLLCPASSDSCGAEAMGWMHRAEQRFARDGELASARDSSSDCDETASAEAPRERYAALVSCHTAKASVHDALPLGRFKAPRDGLLVVAHRNHHCDDLRLYDLATGATRTASSCSRPSVVTRGRVSVAALQEAVWMMALAEVSDTDVRESVAFSIPPPIKVGRTGLRGLSLRGIGTSGGSVREWSWMRRRGPTPEAGSRLAGQESGIIAPFSWNGASRHAGELLDIVELGFVEGCSPTPSTSFGRIDWTEPGPSPRTAQEHPIRWDRPELEAARAALARPISGSTCEPLP